MITERTRKEMVIQDIRTREQFTLNAGDISTYVTTRDGVRVKFFPAIHKVMVSVGSIFGGHTLLGTRDFKRLS